MLTHVYRGIASDPQSFGFVADDSRDGSICGFIAGTYEVHGLTRRALRGRLAPLAIAAAARVWRPSILWRVWQAARYSADVGGGAELLSIAVAEHLRGRGLADVLVARLLAEFEMSACDSVRVTVGAGLKRAVAFYRKHGWRITARIREGGTLVMLRDGFLRVDSEEAARAPSRQHQASRGGVGAKFY